jgi:mRNA interferase MazF
VSYVPDTGDLVKLDLNPPIGHEEAGWRPAIVLSPKSYNARSGMAVVAPITNQSKDYPFEVPLPSGLKITGVVLSDHIKSVDWNARRIRYKDKAPAKLLEDVQERLRLLLFNEA